MADSIMPFDRMGLCYLCHKVLRTEKHHIFGAGMRSLSEEYGLTVYLCRRCHNEPPDGVHFNEMKNKQLKAAAQARAMYIYGWSIEEWRRLFRKDYRGEIQ